MLECAVDGVPSQIPTLKFLTQPAPTKSHPWVMTQATESNFVQYVINILFVNTHTKFGIKLLELTL